MKHRRSRWVGLLMAAVSVAGGWASAWAQVPSQEGADAHYNAGVQAFRNNDLERAQSEFQQAVEANPKDHVALCWLGFIRMKRGQTEDAIKLFSQAIALDGNYFLAYNNRGTAYWERNLDGDRQRALADYERAAQMKPDYVEARFNLARAYLESKRPQGALPHLKKLVEVLEAQFKDDRTQRDNLAQAYDTWGQAFEALNEMSNALGKYRRATELAPAEATYYLNFGLALYREGRFKECISQLQQAVQLDTQLRLSVAHLALGMARLSQSQEVEAQRWFKSYTKLEPNDAGGWFRLGYAYDREGNFPLALEAYQKAAELNPKDPGIINNIGRVYFKQADAIEDVQKFQSAVEQFRKALDIDANFRPALNNLGLAYQRMGALAQKNGKPEDGKAHYEQAEQVWQQLRRLDPRDVAILGALADAQLAQGKWNEAKGTYEALLKIAPSNIPALCNLGLIHHNSGNAESAVGIYNEVLKKDPRNAIAWNNLGVVRERQGNIAEARRCYLKARQLAPDYRDAIDNLRRIEGEQKG